MFHESLHNMGKCEVTHYHQATMRLEKSAELFITKLSGVLHGHVSQIYHEVVATFDRTGVGASQCYNGSNAAGASSY